MLQYPGGSDRVLYFLAIDLTREEPVAFQIDEEVVLEASASPVDLSVNYGCRHRGREAE